MILKSIAIKLKKSNPEKDYKIRRGKFYIILKNIIDSIEDIWEGKIGTVAVSRNRIRSDPRHFSLVGSGKILLIIKIIRGPDSREDPNFSP
jgi:hypothetical protein